MVKASNETEMCVAARSTVTSNVFGSLVRLVWLLLSYSIRYMEVSTNVRGPFAHPWSRTLIFNQWTMVFTGSVLYLALISSEFENFFLTTYFYIVCGQ